jgi:L-alanine-DL-glutamate epimerase-like enolase superfamily enzyme
MTAVNRRGAKVTSVHAAAYEIPTDQPEADGTFAWRSTTLVLCEIDAGGETGLGFTYSERTNAALINGPLAEMVVGRNALDVGACRDAMQAHVRNIGRDGIAATAISAVDLALWDLKAKLLGVALATLLGQRRDAVPIYGSGGFTSYSDETLAKQLGGWVHDGGCRWVKMKIGTDPGRDPQRIRTAREAIGEAGLFIDANGAFGPRAALAMAERAAAFGVSWFEEPVSSDDLDGLRLVRARAPTGMEVAAGEYAYDLDYLRRMLGSGAIDVQQADATRCGGVSGFLAAASLCEAHHTPLSGHCAPAMHLHVAASVPGLRHLEWFHDHARIEHMLFDGAPIPRDGAIRPDLSRPGHGLTFKRRDAERYAARG